MSTQPPHTHILPGPGTSYPGMASWKMPIRESLGGPRREGRGNLKADYPSIEERGQALEDRSHPLCVLVTLRDTLPLSEHHCL